MTGTNSTHARKPLARPAAATSDQNCDICFAKLEGALSELDGKLLAVAQTLTSISDKVDKLSRDTEQLDAALRGSVDGSTGLIARVRTLELADLASRVEKVEKSHLEMSTKLKIFITIATAVSAVFGSLLTSAIPKLLAQLSH